MSHKSKIGAAISVGLALAVWVWPFPALSPEAHRLAAILVLVIGWWIAEPVPLAGTAFLGVALAVSLGVCTVEQALSAFVDPIVFLFIGTFLLARAMQVHALDQRMAYGLLGHPWVNSAPRLIWAVGVTAACIAMVMSITACAAMLFPVVLAISRTLQRPRVTTALLLMLVYGAAAGAIATPVGTPPNLIGIALIRQQLGVSLDFLQWMLMGLPVGALLLVSRFGLLLWMFPPEKVTLSQEKSVLKQRYQELEPWTAGQRNSLLALGITGVLWLMPGSRLSPGTAALIGAGMLLVLPTTRRRWTTTLSWREVFRIDWGTIVLFAGGIALGTMMLDTGLAVVMGKAFIGNFGTTHVAVLVAVSVATATLLSELASNTASANMVIPVMLSTAPIEHGLRVALGATLGAGLGFVLPVSTPAMAMIYASRVIRMKDMVKAGILVDITGVLILWMALLIR